MKELAIIKKDLHEISNELQTLYNKLDDITISLLAIETLKIEEENE